MVQVVNNCCCFLSLRTGTMMIGCVQVVLCLVSLLAWRVTSASEKGEGHPKTDMDIFEGVVFGVLLSLLVLGYLILTGLLVYGSLHERPAMLKPWMLVTWLTSIFVFFISLDVAVVLVLHAHALQGLVVLSVLFPSAAVAGYVQLVVYSYYWSLTSYEHGDM